MRRPAFRTLLAALATLFSAGVHAQQAPPTVLTDTPEYCVHLQHLVLDRPTRPADVNRLYAEGRRMCDHGEVRPGIVRLRRALWLLHHRVVTP